MWTLSDLLVITNEQCLNADELASVTTEDLPEEITRSSDPVEQDLAVFETLVEKGSDTIVGSYGKALLMVSEDKCCAFFRGRLPEGTVYKDGENILADAGICFGLVKDAIYDVLPKRERSSRKRSGRRKTTADTAPHDVVVAKGQKPIRAPQAHIEYLFKGPAPADVQRVKEAMEGTDSQGIEKTMIPFQAVCPGQVLAQIVYEDGEPGCNVYGQEIPPPALPGIALSVGERVVLAEDQQSCAAEIYGYVGLWNEKIVVLSPTWVSTDNMTAFFVTFPRLGACQTPTVKQIQALLEHHYIEHGIDQDAIITLCKDLQEGEAVDCVTPLARGTPSKQGKGIYYQFSFNLQEAQHTEQVQRLLKRAETVEHIIDGVPGFATKAVAAGESLATQQPAIQGTIGSDIFGEEVLPEEAEDEELEVGDFVSVSEDGKTFSSEIYGYVAATRNRISVLLPIWISKDHMEVYLVNILPLGAPCIPSFEQIQKLLEHASVQYGFDYKAIEMFCEKVKHGLPTEILIPLAQGKTAQSGTDGRLEFALDVESRPGTLRKDGSIDFKELNLTPPISEHQLIGTRVPATKGIRGMDVNGQETPAEDGQDIYVKGGEKIRLEQRKGHPDQFFSEAKGGLDILHRSVATETKTRQEIRLAVYPVREVHGNVDYSTGDILYPGTVHVRGSIKSGFNVTAEGSVVIEGHVENKVRIRAGGSLVVQHGIAGVDTQIESGGSIHTKYISGATVHLKEDLTAGSYILNASVRAGGSVTVFNPQQTGRKSGAIIGGAVVAVQQIRAQNVGSNTASATYLIAGVEFALLKKVSTLQKGLDIDQVMINRLMQILNLESTDTLEIKERLQKSQGGQRKTVLTSIKKLIELLMRCKKAVVEKEEGSALLQELAWAARIIVPGKISGDTRIRIGGHKMTVQKNAERVTFSLVEEEETTQLKMDLA